MDQNQGVDNDLQKAIDDITNPGGGEATTVADPVFSEPVAAPSSIPEGDSGELGEPVGPFPEPEPEPQVTMVAPGPEPLAPIDPINIPDLGVPVDASFATAPQPPMQDQFGPAPAVAPEALQPAEPMQPAEPLQPAEPAPEEPIAPAPAPEPEEPEEPAVEEPAEAPAEPEAPIEPVPEPESTAPAPQMERSNMSAHQIKEAALRDLVPLLDRIDVEPYEKFKICRDIFENLHDYSVLDKAYRAASAITDEDERAKSLLYLVESIDRM